MTEVGASFSGLPVHPGHGMVSDTVVAQSAFVGQINDWPVYPAVYVFS